MDIFSHGLWAGAVCKLVNLKIKGANYNYWQAFFFGIFPDLFAFIVPTLAIIVKLANGTLTFGAFPNLQVKETIRNNFPLLDFTKALYDISHSIIIFTIVFIISYFFVKKAAFILFAWLFHILVDIPTHSIEFFATPVFWPISDWRFDGIAWSETWFVITNYSFLLLTYLYIFYLEKKKKEKLKRRLEEKSKVERRLKE